MVVSAAPKQTNSQAVAKVYDRRVDAGLCRYDSRENGGEPHAAPTKWIRKRDGKPQACTPCYDAHLERKRRRPRG
jgi:hypothetical protein